MSLRYVLDFFFGGSVCVWVWVWVWLYTREFGPGTFTLDIIIQRKLEKLMFQAHLHIDDKVMLDKTIRSKMNFVGQNFVFVQLFQSSKMVQSSDPFQSMDIDFFFKK